MAQHRQDGDEVRRAANRSSDVMSAFAKRRHGGEEPLDSRRAGHSDTARMAEGTVPQQSRTTRVISSGSQRAAKSDDADRPIGSRVHAMPEARPRTLGEYVRHNSAFILSVVAVVAIMLLLIAFLRYFAPTDGVSGGGGEGATTAVEAEPARSFDWSLLDTSDGRFKYVVDGQVKSRVGIDISDHQEAWDWEAVAADGVDFAIIRLGYRGATEGDIHLDGRYEESMAGAQAAGLDCGVFFFSQARTVNEAVEEADFVLEHLAGRSLAYPVVFDSEDIVDGVEESRLAGLSADEMTEIAQAFCKRIESAGYNTMIYGNRRDLLRYRDDYLQEQPVWWAEYGPVEPSASVDIALWQYTSTGQVDGISDGVDMSIDLRGVFE